MASERIALPPGMYAISAKGGTVVVPQPGGILSVNSTYTTNQGEVSSHPEEPHMLSQAHHINL